ncbi:unnamed protein product [Leptosia nina]|uniref:Uncharacterized protein n=1 Tax=Leptosia nina TaxID=320188 RepID=A0AAV1J9A6_9NEOP
MWQDRRVGNELGSRAEVCLAGCIAQGRRAAHCITDIDLSDGARRLRPNPAASAVQREKPYRQKRSKANIEGLDLEALIK